MKNSKLKFPCIIAAFYFGMDVSAQQTQKDSVPREQKIEEVVMIGYGSRKKVDNTTAISTINAEEVTKTKVLNATQAIQGKAAGVNVIASDLPGSKPTVIIRGLGTALSGRDPLYVVDGIYTYDIGNINSNDILSYDILKDASALAIYGNRAANGVIIITTKSGRGKKISVEYDGFTGARTPLKTVKMAGSNLFAYYTNTALGSTKFSQDQPINTDWFKAITRTGSYHQNNVSISGSSDNAKYFLSLGNYQENAILRGTDYQRTTVRTNNEFRITKSIILTQNFSVAFTNVTPKPLSAFTAAYKQSPITPVYFPSGHYGVSYVGANGFASENGSSFNNVGNPVAQLDFNNERQNNILMQGGLKLDFNIIKPLKFTSQFSGEYGNSKSYNFSDLKAIWLAADPTRVPSGYSANDNVNTLFNSRSDYFNWVLSNFLTYNQTFSEIHDLELMAGVEASTREGANILEMSRKNLVPDSNYWDLSGTDYKDQILYLNSVNQNRNTTNSYFARAQYKLMNRYLLTASIRRDGSSQFADGHKWGTFPAFGAGWIISEESFMKDGIFDLLKLRGGWGRLGNQNVPLNVLPFSTGSGNSYSFNGSTVSNGTTIDKIYDPELSWEITEESSAGLDFEMARKRLKGSFDVYDKVTKNIILELLPPVTSGISGSGLAHLGQVSNKGFEVALNWDDHINEDWSYSIGGNFSQNKNNVDRLSAQNISDIRGGGLGNGQYTKLFNETSVGQPLGSFWLWEVAGKDANGNFTYVDSNGNGKTGANDLEDRRYFGSYLPTSTFGVNLGMKYKSMDLSVNGYGTLGAKVYNGKKAQRFSGENIEYDIASDFWTPTNTGAANPAPFNAVPIASNYYLESGDFFRINNITLGYTLIKPIEQLSSLRIYLSAINPVIWQKFSGFSPELSGNNVPYDSPGIELDAYPTVRSFLLGLNVKF